MIISLSPTPSIVHRHVPEASIHRSMGSAHVGVQCPLTSSLGEFLGYWDWLWCPGLSPVLVSIAYPFAFHISVLFHSLFTCHWISFVFLLYGRRICTHSVDPSFTHFLGEFQGLGLALVPDVVVPEAEHGCAWSRNLDPNFYPGRGRTSDLGIQRPRTLLRIPRKN